jgi:hypothetical protein
VKKFLEKLFARRQNPPTTEQEVQAPGEAPCCSEKVHVFYRGISDDRLYASYNRKWQDTKFFKPHGLKVFCALCRKRLV